MIRYKQPMETVVRTESVPQLLAEVYPQFGYLEGFVTSGASLLPWYLQAQGVKQFAELAYRWPGFIDFFRNIPEKKFADIVRKLPRTSTERPDVMYMKVGASSNGSDKASFELLDLFDRETGLSATERTTGFPTAILARMQAQGEIQSGVYTPEQALDVNQRKVYLDEVGRYMDIRFIE